MFAKLSVCLLLTASVTGFGQVTTMSTGMRPVSAPDAPLVATPDVALPGSGPAVGVPLGNTNTNDSRVSVGPSIYNPNSIVATLPGPVVSTPTVPATAQPFEAGIQRFESGLPNASASTTSLAEIAKSLHVQHRKATKSFSNDSIAQLNAAGVRTGNLGPESSTVVASSTQPTAPAGETLMAETQPPALPQGDQDLSGQAAPVAQPTSSTAAQQRHRSADRNPGASANTDAATSESATSATSDASANAPKLPQTASYLPLFLLIGGLGVAGGAAYLMRR